MAPPDDHEAGPMADDPAREFLDFWRNYFEQTAVQTRIFLETMQGGKALEQLHHQWLETLGRSLDDFMRSPPFLEVLKQTLRRMVELKRLQDQTARPAAGQAGPPPASDLAGVLERIHGAEQTILSRLAAIEARLGAIEANAKHDPDGPAPPRRPARKERRAPTTRGGDDAS